MIPTQYKDKLPRQMAYAVSAKAISEALEGVPQQERLHLWFSFRNFQGVFQVQRQPRQIMEASYHFWRQPRFFPNIKEEGVRWDLRVGAVRHEDAALVRELMHRDGLPLVRAWLLRHNYKADEEAAPTSIRLFFNEAESTLICQESTRLA